MKSIIFALTLATALILPAGAAAASNYEYKLLHTFTSPPDGASPNGNLIMDKAGGISMEPPTMAVSERSETERSSSLRQTPMAPGLRPCSIASRVATTDTALKLG